MEEDVRGEKRELVVQLWWGTAAEKRRTPSKRYESEHHHMSAEQDLAFSVSREPLDVSST
jgi:hypothetical protein